MPDEDMPVPAAAELRERVRRLSLYGAGWDGFRASAASPRGIEQACGFLDAADHVPTGLLVDLEPDGSVDLIGDVDGVRTILSFAGDGSVEVMQRRDGTWREAGTYALRDAGGRPVIPEEVSGIFGRPAAP